MNVAVSKRKMNQMEKRDVNLTAGLVVETVGEDLLVLVPRSTDAIRLTGSAAEIVSALQAGGSVSDATPGLDELKALGIVSSGSGLSRRVLLRGGAIGLGSAAAVLAMPTAAAASSGGGGGGGGTVINKTLVRGGVGDQRIFTVDGMTGSGLVTVLAVTVGDGSGPTYTATGDASALPTITFTLSQDVSAGPSVRISFQFGGVEYLAAT